MEQGPLGVIPAPLIRWPTKQPRGGLPGQMDGLFSNVLSVLAMVACLLVIGWLVGSSDEQGQHARPEEEPPPKRLRTPSRGRLRSD
jgi:hypothetical protein